MKSVKQFHQQINPSRNNLIHNIFILQSCFWIFFMKNYVFIENLKMIWFRKASLYKLPSGLFSWMESYQNIISPSGHGNERPKHISCSKYRVHRRRRITYYVVWNGWALLHWVKVGKFQKLHTFNLSLLCANAQNPPTS